MTTSCYIIGVLDNGIAGLTPEALARLRGVDLVIGSARTLALFTDQLRTGARTRELTGQLEKIPDWIREAQAQGHSVAVLATGDPWCHGIAGTLGAWLMPGTYEVVPNVSTVQLACARLGLAWQDMRIVSVHRGDTGEWHEGAGPEHGLYPMLRALDRNDRLAVLTSPDNTPDRIARMVVAEGLDEDLRLAVAERLTRDDERIVSDCTVKEAAARRFADPNVLLLWREIPRRRAVLFGLADDAYLQRRPQRGLITRREIRAVSLARLALRADSIVWDVGAGSGALGLEAARLCADGHVYAIEQNPADLKIAAYNRHRLGVHNYSLVQGKAPAGLDAWPDPDAVFIGGSGGELAALIRLGLQRLRPQGRLVMNLVTFENLGTAITLLKASGAVWDVTQLQASRSRSVLDMHRLAAENPVWILCAQVGENHQIDTNGHK
ncbi:precorrin-6y C5,15-methyltransferase (decarboxylating) subunit CbiE [Candidatus Thiosymbion oneisti]|uniref:precorrin-6y C5,15-methyltransferase (decarboxylating) subunit CbiE n=1 Tax=Candidatus Thiosymbion oneisti TaxID=589554 RepID=UPI000B02523A|nr:precorrin-6y C5,15-methyltransferase (decarboxylating) subunit CbiE [Candidatus Thiosymbion oneisti]